MAVAAARPSTTSAVADTASVGNRRIRTRRLTFSGNYATGGETIPAARFGFTKVDNLWHCGVAMAADVATSCPVAYNAATGKMVFFEGSAAGTALSEKTNAEAYPTGCFIDVTAIGY